MVENDGSKPSLLPISVVIPALGNRGHLGDIIAALQKQRPSVMEIIISHSGPGTPEATSFNSFIPIRLLHSDEPLTSGAARNRGAEVAKGTWLAFLDDDVIPASDWSKELASVLQTNDGNSCFVGSIDYDVSGGYWGMCLWFMEFGSVHKYLPSRSVEGGASANMFMHRDVYVRSGGFPEKPTRSVDVEFMSRCRQIKAKTYFYAKATVGHRNIGGISHCLTQAKSIGMGSARVRHTEQLQGDVLIRYPVAIPLLFMVRIAMISYRVARWGAGHKLLFCAHLPGIALALLAWTMGFSKFEPENKNRMNNSAATAMK